MKKKYRVVKVCKPEYEEIFPEFVKDNRLNPEMVKYIPSDNKFEIFIIDEAGDEKNIWIAEHFFYVKRNIKSFTTEETIEEEEING